jgi:serine/threonine protein phosphatase PrpC
MGTTIAAVLVDDSGLAAVNVGDSPILELTDRGLVQISIDDSPVVCSILPGLPSAVVTQTLGGGRNLIKVDPHVHTDDEPLPRRVLLCSDGLTNFVPRPDIADILRAADPEQVVAALAAAALEAGAPDNVTCVLLDIE